MLAVHQLTLALTLAATPVGEDAADRQADPATLLVQAGSAYEAGRFDQAATLYQRLLVQGTGNGHLWYNLGNARLRAGDLGGAIAAYLEAQDLLPRDADVSANLAFARKGRTDDIEPPVAPAALRTLFFWHFSLALRELLQLLGLVNLLFWSGLALRLYGRQSEILRWLVMGLGVVLVALGISFGLRLALPSRIAVVTPAEIDVHSGTSRDTVIRFKLHAGTETEWRGRQDGWIRITLSDGKQGWVAKEDVAALVL